MQLVFPESHSTSLFLYSRCAQEPTLKTFLCYFVNSLLINISDVFCGSFRCDYVMAYIIIMNFWQAIMMASRSALITYVGRFNKNSLLRFVHECAQTRSTFGTRIILCVECFSFTWVALGRTATTSSRRLHETSRAKMDFVALTHNRENLLTVELENV